MRDVAHLVQRNTLCLHLHVAARLDFDVAAHPDVAAYPHVAAHVAARLDFDVQNQKALVGNQRLCGLGAALMCVEPSCASLLLLLATRYVCICMICMDERCKKESCICMDER